MIDRRRLLLAGGKVDVTKLIFSATAPYTDQILTIDGKQYRVLGFAVDSTLTLDQKMLGKVPFDAWVVAGGGNGGTGGSSDYYTGVCYANPNAGFTSNGVYHGCSIGCNIVGAVASGGGAGGSGGWNQLSSHIARYNTLAINSAAGSNYISENGTQIISAPIGGNASGTNNGASQARNGGAWFALPSSNNGNGGASGSSSSNWACSTHDEGYRSVTGGNGGLGTPGIVYIRIPLKY